MAKILKEAKRSGELTRYGNRFHNVSGILFNQSDRTIDQYKRIRMHPMVHMGLSFIKIGLPDVPFVVECTDEDKKRIIEAAYKRIWGRMIKDSLEMLDFGFKTLENLYEVGTIKYEDENGNEKEFSGHLLRQPKSLDPDTIDILVDDKGNFEGFTQDSTTRVMVEDKKALIFVNRWESGNYYGISDQEYIYMPWYDSNINRQFSMRWLERKGTGIFKGTYPIGKTVIGGVDADNADTMLNLLDSIMEGTAVALPSDTDDNGNPKWDIVILDSDDKTDAFIEKSKYLDDLILRGLVIPEKSLTQGEVGARASIESFQAMFIQRKQDVLDNAVNWINQYSLKPFVEINWGTDNDEYKIKAGRIDDNSVIVANLMIQKLIEKGSFRPERNWLIEKTGIPLEEEEIVEEPLEDIPDDDDDMLEKKVDKEEDEEEQKTLTMQEKSMNKREQKFKIADMGTFFTTRSEMFQKDLEENIFTQLERVKRFISKNYNPNKPLSLVKGIKLNQGSFNGVMKQYLKDVYNHSFEKFQSGVEGKSDFTELEISESVNTGELEARDFIKVLHRVDLSEKTHVGLEKQFAEISDNIERLTKDVHFAEPSSFIGFRTSLAGGKFIADLLAEMKFSVSNGLNSGLALTEILSGLTQKVRDFVVNRQSNIADTELAFTLDRANTDYLKVNASRVAKGIIPAGQKIERFVSSAVLDDRTTELCTSLDGLVVEAGSPIMQKFATPRHFHCRSVWLPITQDEIEDPDFADTDITTGKGGKPVTTDQVTAGLENIPVGKSGKSALDEMTF